jgi:hypothetical protein
MRKMEHTVKILKIKNVTHDVKSFTVEKPEGYSFIPGQATEMSINKPGWKDEKRPFTFTSLNEDENLEFTIKEYPLEKHPNHTGVTEQLHKLQEGDGLIIRDVWGAIKYQGPGTFIAGGAGITPFIAILRQLKKDGKLQGNKLIFSNKTAEDVIIEDELKGMLGENLILTLTEEEKQGYEHGLVNQEFLKKNIKDWKQKFYVCGPKQMVKDIREILEKWTDVEEVVFEK